jgi:serine/threonine-protein kinase
MAGESFGEFSLLRKLATGGMAEVFLARRRSVLPGFAKLVAIKRMLPHLAEDPEFIAMFLDEARTASHLNHPNVVQIFDVGEALGTLYLAMEFLDGISIMALLQRNIELKNRQLDEGTRRFLPARDGDRPFDPLYAAAIGVQVCQGLHYAHELTLSGEPMGLVHRDISPQNLMLTFGGVVKVLDFGIAKAAGRASNTRAGALKGKLRYIAPEQYEFRPVDRRTDIYALGVVLYELATATRAFCGEDWEIVQQVQKGQLPPVHQLRAEVPPQFSQVIARAMAVNPDERYQTAAALGEALLEVMRSIGHVVTAADLALMAQARFGEERLDLSPFSSGEHRPLPATFSSPPMKGAALEIETRLLSLDRPEDRAADPPALYEGSLDLIEDAAPPRSSGAVGGPPPIPELGFFLYGLLSLTPRFRPRHFWLYPLLTSAALASVLTVVGVRLGHQKGRPAEAARLSTAPARTGPPIAAPPSPPSPIAAASPPPAPSPPSPVSPPAQPPESPAAGPAEAPLVAHGPVAPVPFGPPAPGPAVSLGPAIPFGPPAPAAEKDAPVKKPPPVRRLNYGYLVIDSKPTWSKVYAYGRLLGQTPIVKHYLPVGWTSLRLVNGKTQEQRVVKVHIAKGEVTTTLVRWQ